jgi:hypothetical protein
MPLLTGKENFGRNVGELTNANKGKSKPRSRKQILAIAYSELGKRGEKLKK